MKQIFVGEDFPVKAEIELGALTPDDVEVQLYYGPIDKQDDPNFSSTVIMNSATKKSNGYYQFTGNIVSQSSGQKGFTIRILPKHRLLINPFELGVVYWAN